MRRGLGEGRVVKTTVTVGELTRTMLVLVVMESGEPAKIQVDPLNSKSCKSL